MRMKMQLLTAAIATLALAGCASTSPGYTDTYTTPAPPTATCYDCGTVTRIDAVGSPQQASGTTGAVLGGVVGAVAGNQLTKDEKQSTQNVATVAGAAAGAVAGSAIQKNMAEQATSYTVYVRMDNGQTVTLHQDDIGTIREGSYVRVYDGRVWAAR